MADNRILFLFFVGLSLFFLNCSKEKGASPTGDIVILIDKTTFSAGDVGTIDANIQIENIQTMDRLEIRKVRGGESTLLKTIKRNEISNAAFSFQYELLESDYNYDEIQFRFMAVRSDGIATATNAIKVNNKFGIYVSNLKTISRLTGNSHANDNGLPNSNNTCIDYDVCGTDLGIIWQIDGNKVGLFFGDTFGSAFQPYIQGGGYMGDNWRSNVLAYSEDSDLEDGLTISDMATNASGRARKVVQTTPGAYNTSIPTSAIRANGVDYVHYMNIYNWEQPDLSWLTNFSSLYASTDNGRNWTRVEDVVFQPRSKFSQVAYGKNDDGYIYMIGTFAGRGSAAYLARIPEKEMANMEKYEYWNGNAKTWEKGDEGKATVIIPPIVGEASLLYHKKYKRWILTYNKEGYGIVYRDTKDITDWSRSREKDLVVNIPGGVYCAFMHPMSAELDKLYFVMSIWAPYNTYLMSVDLQNL